MALRGWTSSRGSGTASAELEKGRDVGLVTLAAFFAPYAYIVGAGSGEMPTLAYLIVGVLVIVIGAAAIFRMLRQARSPELSI